MRLKNIWARLRSIDRETFIKNSFLVPILLVVAISISHVISWYDMGNPIAWAVYLSVAIEIFALASISAAGINVSRASVWFLFGMVTFIQMVGNIFFTYNDIDVNSPLNKSWIELIQPLFDGWDVTDHRRFLAVIQGGMLPLMSLTALHYYIKFNDREQKIESAIPEISDDEAVVTADGDLKIVAKNTEENIEADVPEMEPKQEPSEIEKIWIDFNQQGVDEDMSKYNPQE